MYVQNLVLEPAVDSYVLSDSDGPIQGLSPQGDPTNLEVVPSRSPENAPPPSDIMASPARQRRVGQAVAAPCTCRFMRCRMPRLHTVYLRLTGISMNWGSQRFRSAPRGSASETARNSGNRSTW